MVHVTGGGRRRRKGRGRKWREEEEEEGGEKGGREEGVNEYITYIFNIYIPSDVLIEQRGHLSSQVPPQLGLAGWDLNDAG